MYLTHNMQARYFVIMFEVFPMTIIFYKILFYNNIQILDKIWDFKSLKWISRLKSFFVWRLKEYNTYACKYHVEMVELLKGFNNMSTSSNGIHGW